MRWSTLPLEGKLVREGVRVIGLWEEVVAVLE